MKSNRTIKLTTQITKIAGREQKYLSVILKEIRKLNSGSYSTNFKDYIFTILKNDNKNILKQV